MSSAVEVADIISAHLHDFTSSYLSTPQQRSVFNLLKRCRTSSLGAHKYVCDSCSHEQIAYNSCRNRHCPKCQTSSKEQWLYRRREDLLPVPYYHAVFTVPQELYAVIKYRDRDVYPLFFRAIADTLKVFGRDRKYKLNGIIGFMSILHTWNQQLGFHPHIHCVIAGGALQDNGSFLKAREGFLFPVKAISKVFRGKFLSSLKVLLKGDNEGLKAIEKAYRKKWVVYMKRPFNGPQQVLDYLARYTHRVAISNHRILKLENGKVTFSYRDRKDGNKVKHLDLSAVEFLRRFTLHVLPKNFMKIRSYGFLANRTKAKSIQVIRNAIGVNSVKSESFEQKSSVEIISEAMGVQIDACPACKKGKMISALRHVRGSPEA